ncbi:hypothetical protein SHIRM173S_06925 [Streptomyces hirsutus]
MTGPEIALRAVHDSDLPVFYRQSNDPQALRMAAFTAEDPADRRAFEAHWARIRTAPDVVVRTVLCDGDVVGHAAVYGAPGFRLVGHLLRVGHGELSSMPEWLPSIIGARRRLSDPCTDAGWIVPTPHRVQVFSLLRNRMPTGHTAFDPPYGPRDPYGPHGIEQ